MNQSKPVKDMEEWLRHCEGSALAKQPDTCAVRQCGEQSPCTSGDCFVAKNKGAPRNDMLFRGSFGDGNELVYFQACAADQRAVNIGLTKELGGICGCD